jgi:hypothetical protein
MSQSRSSFVLVRFSGDSSEPSAACFLRSSLFHPGKPASIPPTEDENEDEDDWAAKAENVHQPRLAIVGRTR